MSFVTLSCFDFFDLPLVDILGGERVPLVLLGWYYGTEQNKNVFSFQARNSNFDPKIDFFPFLFS